MMTFYPGLYTASKEAIAYEGVFLFSTKNWSFLEFPCNFKEAKPKKKILDNLEQNIYRLFHD